MLVSYCENDLGKHVDIKQSHVNNSVVNVLIHVISPFSFRCALLAVFAHTGV